MALSCVAKEDDVTEDDSYINLHRYGRVVINIY